MKGIEEFVNRVFCGDCRKVMQEWPDECVDMVLTLEEFLEAKK
jgi:DNA modification methylase